MKPGETDEDAGGASRVLVIGYGNPLRGDDGIGWEAASRLERRLDDPAVDVLTAHQLTPELAERLAEASLVVLIDACAQSPAGSIRSRRLVATPGEASAWNHVLSPAALVQLTKSLFGHPPRAYVVSVGAGELGYREGISESLQTALPLLEQRVLRLIHAWRIRRRDRREAATHA